MCIHANCRSHLFSFSVEYEERGDFIYLQEIESDSEGSDWGSEEGFSDVSEELNQR